MRTRTTKALVLLGSIIALAGTARAQFDSGSDGSDGALNVTTNTTLDLPPDGIFHYTTINVDAGATLRFNANALNTAVHLLASGEVTIAGDIDISGENGSSNPPKGGAAGPGGFRGGDPGITSLSLAPGAGHGPGAGLGKSGDLTTERTGGAAFGTTGGPTGSNNNGEVYGSALLIPMVGGSGGGGDGGDPGVGGGGGAGGILIASNTRIVVDGNILARGGAGGFNRRNDGSGGGIRLVAPEVSGSGTLDVGLPQGIGSAGRMRIDALDRSGIAMTFRPIQTVTFGVAMVAIPDPLPRLDVIEAAGTTIAEGEPNQVSITLPFGSDPNRTIVVQARDFGSSVPIRVTLTPEHGTSSSVDALIDNQASNPAQTTVNVTFPIGVPTSVRVWTR